MTVLVKVKRIGGSTFLLVPPDVARSMKLRSGQSIKADLEPAPGDFDAFMDAVYGSDPDAQYVDKKEFWGKDVEAY